jgi:hypothetical protein
LNLRALIVGLIVLATVGFVVGVSIERNTAESHGESPPAARSESTSSESHGEGGEESEAHRTAESGGQGEAGHDNEGAGKAEGEFQPFGIDIEAAPFVILAALASLAMAVAVWTRPTSLLVLGIVALAMSLFALLDIREVFHQADEGRTGLAVLAGAVAALHIAAAAGIAVLAPRRGPTGRAGTMPA